MSNSRFDIEYKNWLQQVNVDEKDSVWNEIQDELDLNETWDNISANLDEVMPQSGWVIPVKHLKVVAATAAIILIISLPVIYFSEQSDHPVMVSESMIETNEKEKPGSESELVPKFELELGRESAKELDLKPGLELESVKELDLKPGLGLESAKELDLKPGLELELKSELKEKNLTETLKEDIKLVLGNETGIAFLNDSSKISSETDSGNELASLSQRKDSMGGSFSNERLTMPEIKNATFNSDMLLMRRDILLAKTKETVFSGTPEYGGSSGLSLRVAEVGLVFGYKNTWLINHETLNGLNPNKLGNTLPTFHEDIGITSSLELNNQYLFGLEFLWKSETGQNYKQYINASFVDRRISLDYLKLQAFYYWDSNKLPGHTIVGGYIAKLTMAEEKKDKTIISVGDNYSDYDYGLLAGYEFNIGLLNNIILKPGFRISYDLANIFEGDDITPSHFKRTKNLAASFNLSLSYRFHK